MSSIKVMMVGDTHGDTGAVRRKIDLAKKIGDIQRLVILGDFGLWWGHEGVLFLDEINDYAKKNNVQLFAIPGNHECHELWDHMVEGARAAGATSKGWAYVRSHVLLSPKVHEFRWGGKQFVVAGGAVSIDKAYRLEYERHKGKKIWSPNEQLTDDEVETIESWVRKGAARGGIDKVDYLLTHDASNRTPWLHRLKPDHDSVVHRQRIDRVLEAVSPRFHFHGHFHEKYDWTNYTGVVDGEFVYAKTYGLECNDDYDSVGVLDLATDEFRFASELI